MADLQRRPAGRMTRQQREQRAYQLTLATGGLGLVAVVGVVLAAIGVVSFALPFLAAVLAGLSFFFLRRTLGT